MFFVTHGVKPEHEHSIWYLRTSPERSWRSPETEFENYLQVGSILYWRSPSIHYPPKLTFFPFHTGSRATWIRFDRTRYNIIRENKQILSSTKLGELAFCSVLQRFPKFCSLTMQKSFTLHGAISRYTPYVVVDKIIAVSSPYLIYNSSDEFSSLHHSLTCR